MNRLLRWKRPFWHRRSPCGRRMVSDARGQSAASARSLDMKTDKKFEELVAILRKRVKLVKLVRLCVPDLSPSGHGLIGTCPFHHVRPATASLIVNMRRQIFHCFACGRTGDVIAFMREACGHVAFEEAVLRLARRSGIDMRRLELHHSGH